MREFWNMQVRELAIEWSRSMTPNKSRSGRVRDKVPSSYNGGRAAQLNRQVHSMRRAFIGVFLVIISSNAVGTDSLRYFPPASLSKNPGSDEFREQWYSQHLIALGEKSLCCASVVGHRTFRFTWLRTFHDPVAIRLEERSPGNWTIHIKVADGAGGYDPGKLIVDESHTVSANKVTPLLGLLDTGSEFWAMPSIDEERFGLDGSHWIIEVRQGSRYHFVDRWTPRNDPVHAMGELFIDLSGRKFEKVY